MTKRRLPAGDRNANAAGLAASYPAALQIHPADVCGCPALEIHTCFGIAAFEIAESAVRELVIGDQTGFLSIDRYSIPSKGSPCPGTWLAASFARALTRWHDRYTARPRDYVPESAQNPACSDVCDCYQQDTGVAFRATEETDLSQRSGSFGIKVLFSRSLLELFRRYCR